MEVQRIVSLASNASKIKAAKAVEVLQETMTCIMDFMMNCMSHLCLFLGRRSSPTTLFIRLASILYVLGVTFQFRHFHNDNTVSLPEVPSSSSSLLASDFVSTSESASNDTLPLTQYVHPKSDSPMGSQNTSSTTGISSNNGNNSTSSKNIMIIAAYPKSFKRLAALWSIIECYSSGIDTIVISAPDWSHDIMNLFMEGIRESQSKNNKDTNNHKNITVKYYVNNRYDVGLWCDALQVQVEPSPPQQQVEHEPESEDEAEDVFYFDDSYDNFILINDSFLLLEQPKLNEVNELLHALQSNPNMEVVSLNYSLRPKYWLESVARGFSVQGISKFIAHSCIKSDEEKKHGFCNNTKRVRTKVLHKKCISDKFEVNLIDAFLTKRKRNERMLSKMTQLYEYQFNNTSTPNTAKSNNSRTSLATDNSTIAFGLYPSDVPYHMVNGKVSFQQSYTWPNHYMFWKKVLREKLGFKGMKITNDKLVKFIRKNHANKVPSLDCLSTMNGKLYTKMMDHFSTTKAAKTTTKEEEGREQRLSKRAIFKQEKGST